MPPPPSDKSIGPFTRVRRYFALNSSVAGLLSMVVLVGMGEHMAERFLPLYLQDLTARVPANFALGVISIGILAFMDDLLSALYSFPGGYLSDRLGAKRSLLVFNLLSMCGYLIVIFIHTWWAVLAGAAFFISWSAISLPATMELIATAVPKAKRTMGVSVQALVRRIPKLLGPVVGGAFIAFYQRRCVPLHGAVIGRQLGVQYGVRAAFVAALALAAVAMVLQQRLIRDDAPGSAGRKARAEKNPLRLFALMSPGLRNLLVADILIRFCERIPDAFVVIWATRAVLHPVSEFRFGLLCAIENLTAVLIYVPVAHLADRFGKKPFVAVTFVFFTLFPLALLFAQAYPALVAVFILRGLKEFGEPTRKALIMDLAPEDRKAAMFGLYYLIRDVIVSLAALSGAFLWMLAPRVNLLAAFACGVAGTAYFAVFGKDLGTAAPAPPRSR